MELQSFLFVHCKFIALLCYGHHGATFTSHTLPTGMPYLYRDSIPYIQGCHYEHGPSLHVHTTILLETVICTVGVCWHACFIGFLFCHSLLDGTFKELEIVPICLLLADDQRLLLSSLAMVIPSSSWWSCLRTCDCAHPICLLLADNQRLLPSLLVIVIVHIKSTTAWIGTCSGLLETVMPFVCLH